MSASAVGLHLTLLGGLDVLHSKGKNTVLPVHRHMENHEVRQLEHDGLGAEDNWYTTLLQSSMYAQTVYICMWRCMYILLKILTKGGQRGYHNRMHKDFSCAVM